ncbi:uncharacterized protein B0P05DRAFT_635637 [Gilbertella persicaria]|uniref:uncharacterized protein n=1 Tax=Gilbertella persicaria TaxID=101096 RepID=UPI00222059F9|nr:uncharacterized protein B0P05DRAFT_635637 [Gilbertella persicaria]KAI8086950.1 hypothetical protein B0P05DRAFT_635637 [Gilbertella persicaria]
MKENMEQNTTNTCSTPEPSRRYVQWRDEDVGLLLSDLEQPGHYGKWKENKSGYSKRVAEQVFKNVMYHEAIKFKVRWLESRFNRWHEQLTSPHVVQDENAVNNIREKMIKEFPYYDRCKPIFSSFTVDFPAVQHPIAPAEHMYKSDSNELSTVLKPEPIHITAETPDITFSYQQQTEPFGNKRFLDATESLVNKKKKYSIKSAINSDLSEERRIRMLEMELELKKMDHHERMQEMKLEQLRLEIELQKLKRDIQPCIQHTSSMTNTASD